jgi:hypothetical protein
MIVYKIYPKTKKSSDKLLKMKKGQKYSMTQGMVNKLVNASMNAQRIQTGFDTIPPRYDGAGLPLIGIRQRHARDTLNSLPSVRILDGYYSTLTEYGAQEQADRMSEQYRHLTSVAGKELLELGNLPRD